MIRLTPETLGSLPAEVKHPAYDRSGLRTGIVHLGIGAFHRAHQAVYTDAVLAQDLNWAISGVSLRRPTTRDALGPQGCLYTVVTRSGEGDRLRVIGSVREVLSAQEDPAAVLDRLTSPDVRIVSLTVTEKGYCHDPATGALDENHSDIRHDLRNLDSPRSAPGFLVEALRRRRESGLEPFTVLSCDNLPANGDTTGRIVIRLAHLRDRDLGAYVEGEVAFPNSMIDRIVPATTDADRDLVAGVLGVRDAWPVMTEPFSQWVIEDRFPHGRPAWQEAGAELVSDVKPYEHMKLRLLNGSHSTLAYLGSLAGYDTVADAMVDGRLKRLVHALMDREMTPTLHVPPGADIEAYKASLIERFANPALQHRLSQIAMDGSQKIPQRLLDAARWRIAAGASLDRIALAVAAWMRYVTGVDNSGRPYPVSDPLAPQFEMIAEANRDNAQALVANLLAIRDVFGDDLPAMPEFRTAVTTWLDRLIRLGADRVLDDHCGDLL